MLEFVSLGSCCCSRGANANLDDVRNLCAMWF